MDDSISFCSYFRFCSYFDSKHSLEVRVLRKESFYWLSQESFDTS